MTSYTYFTEEELSCPCCGEEKMDEMFMIELEHLRTMIGIPFIVTSAYRCPKHNMEVSTTGETGPHTTGRAIDIKANSALKFILVERVRRLDWSRIGIGKTFIHIDNLTAEDGFPEDRIWTY